MKLEDFRPGLYRHFKGAVYFADTLMKDQEGQYRVHYCNALMPQIWYARPLVEWDTDVTDRIGKDNAMRQTHRFERITSFSASVDDLSTEQLVRELASREDSPLHGLDLECLMSSVSCVDYCVGTFNPATKECGAGVYTHASFETKEDAFHSRTFQSTPGSHVYKRTFIEVV